MLSSFAMVVICLLAWILLPHAIRFCLAFVGVFIPTMAFVQTFMLQGQAASMQVAAMVAFVLALAYTIWRARLGVVVLHRVWF